MIWSSVSSLSFLVKASSPPDQSRIRNLVNGTSLLSQVYVKDQTQSSQIKYSLDEEIGKHSYFTQIGRVIVTWAHTTAYNDINSTYRPNCKFPGGFPEAGMRVTLKRDLTAHIHLQSALWHQSMLLVNTEC